MLLQRLVLGVIFSLTSFALSPMAFAGGVALGATRVIYPAGEKQISLPVTNSDKQQEFLIQSWVEDSKGNKNKDFIVTPPLFKINPRKENTLRIVYVGNGSLPKDKESQYWLNVKAIPAANKGENKTSNTLQIAVLSRIKLFYRPQKLTMKAADAPQNLTFSRKGGQLVIRNPTPYYITLVNINDGGSTLKNTMVSPMMNTSVVSSGNGGVTFKTINDYGAMTDKQSAVIQ
jgi:fimbrial chaperone protein